MQAVILGTDRFSRFKHEISPILVRQVLARYSHASRGFSLAESERLGRALASSV